MKKYILILLLAIAQISSAQGGWGNYLSPSGGTVSGSIFFSDGTVTVPSLSFSSNPDNGFYWTNLSVDSWSASVGGREIARFLSAGAVATTQFIISPGASFGAAATPSLAFGDGNTGFWESSDNTLKIVLAGAEQWEFTSNIMQNRSGTGPALINVASTKVKPVYARRGDNDTGMGFVTAGPTDDALSLTAGGVEGIRITEATRIDVAVNGAVNYAADGQTDDDYEVAIPAITILVAGLTVTFLASTANTGPATLEITSVGDLDAILKQHDVALADNDIEAGQIVVVVFDGTNWQMVSQIAN